ncbi:hypothetical protein [Pseudarthrobacter raffinosi]|uniref:hypothetical protein n=1 Tax=Pseudarthrobacter raffinosi TaxID=2953651 RepID=UPI00208E425A|nr:hypothetical protein [Pseudarthrobacter sp. MDT3-9]MCO4252087.1 hypothetical protein [Pseudarthrobacter sp. MDT3-9]
MTNKLWPDAIEPQVEDEPGRILRSATGLVLGGCFQPGYIRGDMGTPEGFTRFDH